jgi:uncharacterized damage-inducible protein DinB
MTMAAHLRRLFTYDDWSNSEVARALATARHASERSRQLLAHIIASEWVWRSRVLAEPQPVAVWPDWHITESVRQAERLRSAWDQFFSRLNADSLESSVSYVNSHGAKFSSTVGDILMHIVLHSAYHRGQIAAEMRAAGDAPVYSDFIHAARQGKL